MKQEIIIISDIWGAGNSTWLNNFQHQLLSNYKIKFYDACRLGQIDVTHYEEEHLHKQFLNFGIENAVNNLLRIEKEAKTYITCSIGGTFVWKAALKGLPVKQLLAISPTRLRMETDTPEIDFKLVYGREDQYKPDITWLYAYAKDRYQIIDGDHQIYKDKEAVIKMLSPLVNNNHS